MKKQGYAKAEPSAFLLVVQLFKRPSCPEVIMCARASDRSDRGGAPLVLPPFFPLRQGLAGYEGKEELEKH